MKISNSIKKAKMSLRDVATDYMTNVITVDQYSISVASLSDPVLHYTFDGYNDYVAQLKAVKESAIVFDDKLFLPLQNLPGQILGYNDTFVDAVNSALFDANKLLSDPTNEVAKEDLVYYLTALLNRVTGFKNEVVTLYDSLVSYSSDLPNQSAELKALADTAYNQEQVDQEMVTQLTNEINDLKSEIKSLTNQVIALAITDAACIILGGIAVIAAGPFGAITWIFLGAAIGISTYYIAIDSKKIQVDKALIEVDSQAIDGYTEDATTLEVQSDQCLDLSNCAIAVQENMTALINIWSEIESAITETLNDLNSAKTDFTAEYWQGVIDDLNASLEDWNALMEILTPLQISVQANNASLTIGMSSSEVETAVNNAQTTDFQTYLNNLYSVA